LRPDSKLIHNRQRSNSGVVEICPIDEIKGDILKRTLIVIICLLVGSGFFSLPLSGQQSSTSHPLGSHLSNNYQEDLDGLLKRRYIRVLTTLNQTNFFLHRGKFFGYEYEIVKAKSCKR
jgi:hypothetical protein